MNMITRKYISIETAIALTSNEIKFIVSMADVCMGKDWKSNPTIFKELEKRYGFSRTYFQSCLASLVEKKIIERLGRGKYKLTDNVILSGNLDKQL